MAGKDKRIDPFDVEALEKSLNDSATRVSTIWVSFLIFSLYLLTAAATVTHRQLFLAEPVKLPVLNIDLPLWGFFFLAPILFVILHAYVLMQVILLSRTAAAYSVAVDRLSHRHSWSPEAGASLRQRLANTLFAQIFAGSPREREGSFGWLLNAMAWITLAFAPIVILLCFQFKFLPYHSHLVTWTHRLLILVEFAIAFQLWPLVLRPERDFRLQDFRLRLREVRQYLLGLMNPGRNSRDALRKLQLIPVASTILFILVSLWLATFPGEPHVNILAGQSLGAVHCQRLIQRDFNFIDLRYDRLILPYIDVVNDEKLAKIDAAASTRNAPLSGGEPTLSFRGRNLDCSELTTADLRRVDLTDASLSGADLSYSALRGARLFGASLQGAVLIRSQLQNAGLSYAKLQGAELGFSDLQGAAMIGTELQGASLGDAQVQGANLLSAQLQGAVFNRTNLRGASLTGAHLQGASLKDSYLEGASLAGAQLQGTDLESTVLTYSQLNGAWTWQARKANCDNARVVDRNRERIVSRSIHGTDVKVVEVASAKISEFVERAIRDIPDAGRRAETRTRMLIGLTPAEQDEAAVEANWSKCDAASKSISQIDFDRVRVNFLHKLVCENIRESAAIVRGIVRNWIADEGGIFRHFSSLLAHVLLGSEGKGCAATAKLDDTTKELLRNAASKL